MSDLKSRTRSDYTYLIETETRWNDNDMLGHLNNVVFNRLIEAVVVRFTLGPLGVDWRNDEVYPVAVETLCRFHAELSFPDVVTAALRVSRLGNSSITYEVALFAQGSVTPAATGHFIHVFVDRETGKSTSMPDRIRAGLAQYQK